MKKILLGLAAAGLGTMLAFSGAKAAEEANHAAGANAFPDQASGRNEVDLFRPLWIL